MIRIILIRHGRTAWNADDEPSECFHGSIDLPLVAEGAAQAHATSHRLAHIPLAAIYSSPLQRAAETARTIARPHGLHVQKMPGLRSMDYGHWAGQSYANVADRWPELYRRWRHDPFSIQIPFGEGMPHLRHRALVSLQDILTRHASGDTLALVSHQVVTRTIVCAVTGMPGPSLWLLRQELCNLSHLDYDPARKEFVLVGLNDTCHLARIRLAPSHQDPAPSATCRPATRIIFVRHGQTAWNAGAGEERFRGRTDLPLNRLGEAQAQAIADRLERAPVEAVYASPLLRTQQTAAPLAKRLGLPVQPHANLLDINYGRFQGLTHAQASRTDPELYAQWRSTPSRVRFPGGEGLADVQARLLDLLQEAANLHQGQTVILIGHQIVNKVLVCTLLGLNLDQIWQIQQDTCGLDIFEEADGGWCTVGLNDVCHLSSI
jgi:probable phosphoglycerate mutase